MNVFPKTSTITAFFSCPIIRTMLLAFTWLRLSLLSVLYIVVAFTYLDIRLFSSKAARMFISLFRAGIFVCASAHSGEQSCWEIRMSHSMFRFPAPYLFPMRKPWIKDLCPIGPEPSAPLFYFGCFSLETKGRKSGWSIKNQSVISQLTAKNIILCTDLKCLRGCKFLPILKCLRGC